VERAAAAGKPVFCDVPLHRDDAHADDLRRRLAERPVPVLMAPAPALTPAFLETQRLLAGQPGAPRMVRWDVALPTRGTRVPRVEAVLRARPLLGLLQGCAELLGGEPAGILATAPEGSGYASLLLDFAGGRAAHLTVTAGPGVRPASRLSVAAGCGGAAALLPRRLRWSDAGGDHALRLPPHSAPADLLGRFAAAVAAGEAPRPGFDDAYRALTWWRAAARSQAEGRRVEIGPPADG
jgi:predicted dehydrogenase